MAFNRSSIRWGSLYVPSKAADGTITWKAVSLDKLTDAQIKNVIGNSRNAGALADGWTLNGSTVTQTPAPVQESWGTPRPPDPPAGTNPAGTTAPAFSWSWSPEADGDYLNRMASEQYDYSMQWGQLQAQLAQLNAVGLNGKTMYENLMEQHDSQSTHDLSRMRSAAARRGALVSGFMDRSKLDHSRKYFAGEDDIVRRFGTNTDGDNRSAAYGLTTQSGALQNAFRAKSNQLLESYRQSATQKYLDKYGDFFNPSLGG
jgi:hypothetical protein